MKNLPLLKITAFVLSVFISFQSQAQISEKKIDAIMESYYAPDEPGGVLLIAKEGDIVFEKAYGMANLELKVPMEEHMVFEIGSITKQFTAVSILMLMEEGKLSLDDDITKFIEDYPTHGHHISIHHLLTHTSGIKSYTSLERWMSDVRKDYEPLQMIDYFKNEPMDFAPGEKFLYNNSAYFILGYVIEKASGMSYEEFLETRIFQPLDMENSYYGSQLELIPNRAYGYQGGDGFKNAQYVSLTQPYAAGSIMSTVEDMHKWQEALKNNTLISEESLQKAHTNYSLNNGEKIDYGYGWMINEIQGSRSIEHGGGIFGYTCNGIWMPEEDIYIILLTNRDDVAPGTPSTRIAAVVKGDPYPIEKERIELDEDYLKSLSGVYDFEDGTTRYLIYEDGKLKSKREGGGTFEIYPVAKDQFVFANSLASYTIRKKGKNEFQLIFHSRGDQTVGTKTNRKIPKKNEVKVATEILQKYTGSYEIQANFKIHISLEGDQLMAQATGQGKFPIYPESPTLFYYEVVAAKIEFFVGNPEEEDYLILYQGGQEIKGVKK